MYQQIAKYLVDEVQRGRVPLPESNPAQTQVKLSSLKSLQDMVSVLEARESCLLRQLVDSILDEQSKSPGSDPLQAWNDSQDTGFALAQAFCERFVAECFVKAIYAIKNQRLLQVLHDLAECLLLSFFEKDPWFFASHFFEGLL